LYTQFMKAVDWAGQVLDKEREVALQGIQDRSYLQDVVNKHINSKMIVLNRGCSWMEAITKTSAMFVVLPEGFSTNWMVQTVPESSDNSFLPRKDLPLHWGGLRDKDLANVTGVDDAVFCHKGLFLAIAKSRAGAKQLAQLALEY